MKDIFETKRRLPFIIFFICLAVLIGSGLVYLKYKINSSYNTSKNKNTSEEDFLFTPNQYGWQAECVYVRFQDNVNKQTVINMLEANNIVVPQSLYEKLKPFGDFVPTVEIIVKDYEQTYKTLKEDPRIVDVSLRRTSLHEDTYGDNYVYVLFDDNLSAKESVEILKNEYHYEVNGTGTKTVIVRLTVDLGRETLTADKLRESSYVEKALQCPKRGPIVPL